MAVKLVKGDLFESDMQTLTNTVNCVGVMGKGVALEFKKRYPKMYKDYQARCKNNLVKLGEPYLYEDEPTLFEDNSPCVSILNFPTKNHWRNHSNINDIANGLDYLAAHYKEWRITSIAFPPLGCGNGGLNWEDVCPLMMNKLEPLDLQAEIYALGRNQWGI